MATIKLKKGDHTVTTTVPAEAVQLRAVGYRDIEAEAEAEQRRQPTVTRRAAPDPTTQADS